MAGLLPYTKSRKRRGIAITGAKRSIIAPETYKISIKSIIYVIL